MDTPRVAKRTRGLTAFLNDISNSAPPNKRPRRCSQKATTQITEQVKPKASRGVHAATHSPPQPLETCTEEEYNVSLKYLVKKRSDVLEQGLKCMQNYTERNTTLAVQKSYSLQMFAGLVLNSVRILKACDLVAACTPFAAHTVRKWAADMFVCYFSALSSVEDVTDERLELELQSDRGRHSKNVSLMTDENFRKDAREYVLNNSNLRGKPNLTLQQFVVWVKEQRGVEICIATASLWMHDLGFTYKQFSKGVYFDGHEREDVVKQRDLYLEKLTSCSHRMWISHSPAPNPCCRPVIRVYHDESTFYANADQTFHWTDGSKQTLKQKSLGQAIMVSDFVEEVGGFLQYREEKACLLLEHQTDGYFTNDMLIDQVRRAIPIFEKKYPVAQGLFIFDHAPSHMKRPDDALNAERMNVKDGGKQPFMMDTTWQGHVQRTVTDAGVQKGMKTVLEERGVRTQRMNADKLRELLRQYEVQL